MNRKVIDNRKRFQFLGYIIEYSPVSKRWYVLDWDYEGTYPVGMSHGSRQAAMEWCAN